ncbi:hypothetical protein AMTRI_Chr07g79760 [Amborella trichopoda]
MGKKASMVSTIALVAILAMALAISPAERYSKCGCSSIHKNGGYDFVYNGQTSALYNQDNCEGVVHTRFGSGASDCSPFGWKSIFIQC